MFKYLALLMLSFSLHGQVSCRNNRLSEWIIRGILTKNEEIQKTFADVVTMCGEPKVLKVIDTESLQKKIIIMEHYSEQLKRQARDCSAELQSKIKIAQTHKLNVASWHRAENSHCWNAYIQLAYYIEILKGMQYAVAAKSKKEVKQ